MWSKLFSHPGLTDESEVQSLKKIVRNCLHFAVQCLMFDYDDWVRNKLLFFKQLLVPPQTLSILVYDRKIGNKFEISIQLCRASKLFEFLKGIL